MLYLVFYIEDVDVSKYSAGDKFNNWVLVSKVDALKWLARCVCGEEKVVWLGHLRSGKSKGCLACNSKAKRTAAYHNINEHRTWESMKQRCLNPNCDHYKNYGGRGITICDRWLESFDNFFEDMGKRPSLEHSIDRINNDGNYELSNCKWSTYKEQNNNQRARAISVIDQEVISAISKLGNPHNLTRANIKARIKRGMPMYEVINTPLMRKTLFTDSKGNTYTIKEWVKLTGVPYATIAHRLRKGDCVDDAVYREVQKSILTLEHKAIMKLNKLTESAVITRISRGMSIEEAITRPDQNQIQHTDSLGNSKTIREWAIQLNIKKDTIRNRLRRGWPIDEALYGRNHKGG